LRDARALARATIINYVPFIHDFLRDCFGSEEVKLSRLDAAEFVNDFETPKYINLVCNRVVFC
jgi:hypothetical protein